MNWWLHPLRLTVLYEIKLQSISSRIWIIQPFFFYPWNSLFYSLRVTIKAEIWILSKVSNRSIIHWPRNLNYFAFFILIRCLFLDFIFRYRWISMKLRFRKTSNVFEACRVIRRFTQRYANIHRWSASICELRVWLKPLAFRSFYCNYAKVCTQVFTVQKQFHLPFVMLLYVDVVQLL